MAEVATGRSALEGVLRAGTFGAARPDGPGIVIAERRGLSLLHLAGRPDRPAFLEAAQRALEAALPLRPNTTAAGPDVTVFWLGPTRWLVESATIAPAGLERRLSDAGALTDVSGGRTVLRLAGPAVRRTLAKGCPIDLHPRAFPPGAIAQSALEGVAALLHVLPDGYTIDLYVPRSFARHTVEWLLHAAAEAGCRVETAAG